MQTLSIIKPHITEKTMQLANSNKYTFIVSLKSSKAQISTDIQAIYGFKPVNVKIINQNGKKVLFKRQFQGKKKDFKKAIITLNKKDKIKDYTIKEK